MIRLYSYFRSSAAYRVRIALHLKNIPFETVPVNLLSGEQRGQDYLAQNPQGRVPLLTDGAMSLSQSLAICEYLDETTAGPALLWGSAAERARIRQMAQLIACDTHPLTNLNVLQYLTGPLGHDDAVKMQWYEHFAGQGLRAFEALLAQNGQSGDFCLGDRLSLADLCLVPQMYNMRRFGFALDELPRCRAIEKFCMSLPAFQQAAPESQPDAPDDLDAIHGPDAPLLKAA